MALRMLRPFRRDGEFERLRRRHLPAVYHYALAVLPGEADAHEVTRATFDRARARLDRGAAPPPARWWLVDTAHELARTRLGDGVAEADLSPPGGACLETERLLSRALDGGLARADRRRLRDHLGRCERCRTRERSYRGVRLALRSLATIPVPAALLDERGGSLGPEERRPMGIVNRRNAVIGWVAWQVGKRVAKRKAKSAAPAIDTDSRRPNKPAIAAAIAALVGGLVFWKRQRGDSEATE
jgi:Putative zinc-finger